MLAAVGGIISGWSLYVKDGKPTFHYNLFDVEHTTIQSPEVLSPGKANISVEFTPVGPAPGAAANVRMLVNGTEMAKGVVNRTVPFRYGVEPFDVGRDTVSPVSGDYKSPYPFQGQMIGVTIDLN